MVVFFVTRQNFESRINIITFHFWKIQILCTFVRNNFEKIINMGFINGDIEVYVHALRTFLYKELIDPKGISRKVCSQFSSEFLIMSNLFRENAC